MKDIIKQANKTGARLRLFKAKNNIKKGGGFLLTGKDAIGRDVSIQGNIAFLIKKIKEITKESTRLGGIQPLGNSLLEKSATSRGICKTCNRRMPPGASICSRCEEEERVIYEREPEYQQARKEATLEGTGVRENRPKYKKYPCARCQRLVTQGYHTDKGVVCKTCYKKEGHKPFYEEHIKMEGSLGESPLDTKGVVWVRVGDTDDYTQWPTLQDAIDFLLSRMAIEPGFQSFRRVSLGLEVAPYYEDNNYISIYWGDAQADPIRELSHREYRQVEQAISDYANSQGSLEENPKSPKRWTEWLEDGKLEVDTWFERDRAFVGLKWKGTDEYVYEVWDDAVQELIDDGYLDPDDFGFSLAKYMDTIGIPLQRGPKRRVCPTS